MELNEDKVMINIQRYGNTTNGFRPLCLWEWEDKLKKGDNIILSAFGGGFTWGQIILNGVMIEKSSLYVYINTR